MLIKSISSNTYQWPVNRSADNSTKKKLVGVHEITETISLAAQVAQIHQMMNNIRITHEVATSKSIEVVTDASELASVYSECAHLFKECSYNTNSINYVGNNKYNNLYNNTYNPS